MDVLKKFRDHTWFFLGILVLGWVVAMSYFPAEHIVLGGDVFQPVNMKEQYANFHYGWFSGRVSLFYSLFYLLDTFGVSATAQLSWYLGVFLVSAYLSFWLFSRLIFPNTQKMVSAILSLFYATNVYTLYIFTATWGFTSYQILYVFIPALVGLYLKVLKSDEKIFLLWFFVVMGFASMSFSNPAFAVSLALSFVLLTVFLFLFRFSSFDKSTVKKVFILVVGTLLLNAYWILPLLPQMRTGIQEISISTDIVLSEALQKTSNSIFDTIRLLPTHEQEKYYPYNFPYPTLSFMKEVVAFLAFIPFLVILLSFLKRGAQEKIQLTFFGLLVVFIVLVARVRFPFDIFNNWLFQLPVFNALRGWDKLAIYTPFIISALLLGAFSLEYGKKRFRVVFIGFCLSALLLALPFYAGGIQTELSYILSGNKKKDYTTAGHSALIRIPDPYFSVGKIFKDDSSQSKISMLPFSPGSSVGRVDLPKLKINGPHPANALYAKKYVELNDYYISKWIFAEEFEKSQSNPDWIMDLYGLLGIEYVFYHHDAKPKSLERFEPIRKILEEKGYLTSLAENEWFTLYRLNDKYLFPYVYSSSRSMELGLEVDGISEEIRDFRSGINSLQYELLNPKEIAISLDAYNSGSSIYLNERYDPLWQAEYVSPDGKRAPLVRNNDVRYANAWKVDEIGPQTKISIYYLPERLLRIGGWVSGVTIAFVAFGVILVLKKNRK